MENQEKKVNESSSASKSIKSNEKMTDEQEASLSQIFNLIASSSDSKTISEFFACLMTPAELKDLAVRWILVNEIEKGTTQREIAKKYHISLCKITRGSKELKKDGSAFKKFIEMAKANGDK